MSETCQKFAFTYPIVVLKCGLKNNGIKIKIVNRPLEIQKVQLYVQVIKQNDLILNLTPENWL